MLFKKTKENRDIVLPEMVKSLNCFKQQLKTLELEGYTSLEELRCACNYLSTLDLSNNHLLKYLDCNNNYLGALDLSNNPLLEQLYCDFNCFKTLDLSNNPLLEVLSCSGNYLTALDLSKNSLLKALSLYNIGITSLDLTNNPELIILDCIPPKYEDYIKQRNFMNILDLSKNLKLEAVSVFGVKEIYICKEQEMKSWVKDLKLWARVYQTSIVVC